MKTRCAWVPSIEKNPEYVAYHDQEWGVPIYDEQKLFSFLILEGAQAGLNWATILKKRKSYNEAFDHFDAQKIVHYDDKKKNSLLQNAGIVRNRLKIEATIHNAKGFLKLQEEQGSFGQYLWSFVEGKPLQNSWQDISQVPVSTKQSDEMSKALKSKGFKFVGTTICYAFMQAVGMVNDHTTDCYRHQELKD